MNMSSLRQTFRFGSMSALAACAIGLAACNNAPWATTKPAAPGSTASNPISADGSPAKPPRAGEAGAAPGVVRTGPFPAPWQGLWRGEGTDHMTDGTVMPFSMELTISADTNPETQDPNRWIWSMRTNADLSTAGPDGALRSVDARSGKWMAMSRGGSDDAWFADGTLSVQGNRGDLRELVIYRLDRDGDREYIDIERTVETPRAVAGATPLGTSDLHPGAVLRARLWRVEVTPEPAAQPQ